MFNKRIIPTLLINEYGDLIKGTTFRKHDYVGDPINAVKIFNEKEVDEIIILDISATNNKKINFKLLEEIASEAFMPIAYGGGINQLDDAKKLLYLGFEKIILNSVNFIDLNFLKICSETFGSSTIVCAIDYKKNIFSGSYVKKNNGSSGTNFTPIEFAKILESNGAGELLFCNIDHEGTYKGYDIETIKNIADSVSIPIIASGGAKDLEDIKKIFKLTKVSAAAAGSLFVYYGVHKAVLINYPDRQDLEEIISYE